MCKHTFVCAGLILLFPAGCSGPSAVRNNLSGRVLLDGRPVTDGIVTLHGAAGEQGTSSILPDGTYSVDDPPIGTCQITVQDPPGGAGPDAHATNPAAVRTSRIPARYRKPGNGLEIEVSPGRSAHDICLSS
jgi:hypothetical protein